MTIADTDVLIDYPGGKGEADTVQRLIRRGALRITVVNRFELLSGAKNHGNWPRLPEFLDAVPSVMLDDATADAASDSQIPPTSWQVYWNGG